MKAGLPQAAAGADFDHTYYQGLAVELGNARGFQTCVPRQDYNKQFLGRKLSETCTLNACYDFTCRSLIDRASTVDVVWFNQRHFPNALIEVEFTTDFHNSLIKFVEFQDFRIHFVVVADAARRSNWQNKIGYAAYAPVREHVRFLDFERLAVLHSAAAATANAEV